MCINETNCTSSWEQWIPFFSITFLFAYSFLPADRQGYLQISSYSHTSPLPRNHVLTLSRHIRVLICHPSVIVMCTTRPSRAIPPPSSPVEFQTLAGAWLDRYGQTATEKWSHNHANWLPQVNTAQIYTSECCLVNLLTPGPPCCLPSILNRTVAWWSSRNIHEGLWRSQP